MALAMPDPAQDPSLELRVPEDDVADPEVSIVIPALNEQLTIQDFVAWCREGLSKAGVAGEVLIVDSSTDKTAELALAAGARVLVAPKRGLGRAYLDALPFIRGQYVLMGDCDCTYDFRELAPFVEKFHEGYELVMGSRFNGYIEPGAMPPLHRYFGTPITTWILNVIFSSHYSDIHCGMRGIRRDSLMRMDLRSQSWEYASEMVIKSAHMRLKTAEVPIRFLKDREGRLSHHKRSGWFSPWQAGWINLRAMFIYGAAFFLYRPGLVLLALGLSLVLPLSGGPLSIGRITFSLNWMLVGLSAAILGLQCVYMGALAQVFFDYSGEATARWVRRFPFNRSVFASAGMFVAGIGLGVPLVRDYVARGFLLPSELGAENYLAVTGLWCMVTAFMTFTFALVLHATLVQVRR